MTVSVPRNAVPRSGAALQALFSEATKFATVRALPVLAGTAVLAAALTALLFCVSLPITQGVTAADLPAGEVLAAALLGIDVAAVVLVVLGASFAGSEYATGLAQPTFVLTPRRGRVLLAKAAVTAGVAAVVAVLAAVLCVAVGQAVLVASGLPAAQLDAALLRLAAGSALTPVFYALVALAGAMLTRSTGGGVTVALGLLFLPAVVGWLPGPVAGAVVALPAAALHGISGAADPGTAEYLPAGAAAAALLAWTAVLLGAAAARLRSRDV